ncbi:MAG TPA: SDR family oxidoreductase [Caulobacteraceae bacterium]|nr:SDR family oxidoreductase [Caulobacteraceae bacterium]
MEQRTVVVTGAASGIGAATSKRLRDAGHRVIGSDLHDADVIADLTTAAGRAALAAGVAEVSGGRIDAIVANAGGGPAETSLQLNFFGAVGALEGLRPLLAGSRAPRAVAVSSISSLRPPPPKLIDLCLAMDEQGAVAEAWRAWRADELGGASSELVPDAAQVSLDLYGAAKRALQLWCRRAAPTPAWGGAGIPLNVVALGFYETPAAAYVLDDPAHREAMGRMVPLAGAYPGKADEAAAILAWCISPENSQMTGQVLFADGGVECLATMEQPR